MNVTLTRLLKARKAYDPDQPRADDGKWTAGAYAGGTKETGGGSRAGKYSADRERIFAAKPLNSSIHDDFAKRLEETFGGPYNMKHKKIMDAILAHSGSTTKLDDKSKRKYMDRAFKRAAVELQEDAIVYRGLRLKTAEAEKLLKAAEKSGRVYIQQNKQRYVPTSTSKSVADKFAGNSALEQSVRLRVFLPKGSRVLPIANVNGYKYEQEVTLNRGARFRVVGGRKLGSGYKAPIELTVAYVGGVHNKKSSLKALLLGWLWKSEQDRGEHFSGDLEYIEIQGDEEGESEILVGAKTPFEDEDEFLLEPGAAAEDDDDGDPEWRLEEGENGQYEVKEKLYGGSAGGAMKSWSAPSSATSGMSNYDLEGNRGAPGSAGVGMRPKRRHFRFISLLGRAKFTPLTGDRK